MPAHKKTTKELPDGWQGEILDLYKNGASDAEIKAKIAEWTGSCSNDLWTRWMKEEKEFSKVVKQGRLLAEAWWQRFGRENLHNKDFSPVLWYMNMKNRFGWRDKQDITTGGEKMDALIHLPPKIKE